MTRWRSIGGVLVLLAAVNLPLLAEDNPDKDKARIAKLIQKLGSDEQDDRDDAEEQLGKLGPKALEALRKASDHSDVEIRRRARKLAGAIEYQMTAEALLAPKKVRLKLDDVTVAEAVEQLAKLGGYRIDLSSKGNKVAVAKRKVTLDVGEVTFNEALDALCRKARLVQGRAAAPVKERIPGPETIVLSDGVPSDGPAVYAGSVRLRVLPPAKTKKDELFALPIEAVAEPRLREFRVVRVGIDRATDDQGQKLDFVADYVDESRKGRGSISINGRTFSPRPAAIEDRTATAALKKGEKSAKSLRELKGFVVVSALHEGGPFAALEDVLSSAGKSASGKPGYSMKVNTVEELDNGKGEVKVTASVSMPLAEDPDVVGLRNLLQGGNVRFKGRVNINGVNLNGDGEAPPPTLRLFDEKGRAWEVVSVSDVKQKADKERRECSLTLRYRPPAKGAKAAKLEMFSTEPAGVVVPFTLKDVPLK
jgi:hypothetical protein